MDTKNKRKPNWTEEEMVVLADGVRDRLDIIKGKFSATLTAEKKTRSWMQVVER